MATPNGDLVAAILAVADNKTLGVQTSYKPTETFQYTHLFSSDHPLRLYKTKQNIQKCLAFHRDSATPNLKKVLLKQYN